MSNPTMQRLYDEAVQETREQEILVACIRAGIEKQFPRLDLIPPRKKAWYFVRDVLVYCSDHNIPLEDVLLIDMGLGKFMRKEWLEELAGLIPKDDYNMICHCLGLGGSSLKSSAPSIVAKKEQP